jgi:hypothetical protein
MDSSSLEFISNLARMPSQIRHTHSILLYYMIPALKATSNMFITSALRVMSASRVLPRFVIKSGCINVSFSRSVGPPHFSKRPDLRLGLRHHHSFRFKT